MQFIILDVDCIIWITRRECEHPHYKIPPVSFHASRQCRNISKLGHDHFLAYPSKSLLSPPPWSSGQNSWLQIQKSRFDSRRHQIFWEVVGLERGPLSLVSTTEELFGRKSNGSGQEKRNYGSRGSAALSTRHTSIHKKLALIPPTSGGLSFDIVRSRTKATELFNY
jgi:hypothetical protein